MIIPSIDLMDGNAVQLVGGKEKVLDAGRPHDLASSFGMVGEIAVIDLDAALSRGSNEQTIIELLSLARCRVGGGIRDVETALKWLDRGAAKVILGTKATPEVLNHLPPERVIAALDAYDGEVVVEGWRTKTGRSIIDRMRELNDYVSGYLVTFVEREGRLGGTALERVAEIVGAAQGRRVTIAGGVTTADEIAELDRLGADAQVGMALYTGRISLAEAFLAPCTSDRADGLIPTVVTDEHGVALGLVYSSRESVAKALELGEGVYYSRSRGLWHKGATSGDIQELCGITLDCDRDALRFTVRQKGAGFCHLKRWSCFEPVGGLPSLARRLTAIAGNPPTGSYTARLLSEEGLLDAKIHEEARELCEATAPVETANEAADLLYFTLVKMIKSGVTVEEVERILDQRSLKVIRRKGDAK